MYNVDLEKFSGPLALLLQLIDQQKLEITEVSISQVTDQYLAHLEKLTDKDPEELSDFLVLAARLLLLKSKALLPIIEEEEEIDELEKQLKIYKEFLDASKKIEKIIAAKSFAYSRERLPQKIEIEFSPPVKMPLDELRKAFVSVLNHLAPLVKISQRIIDKTVSLQKRILEIKDWISQSKQIGFKELMGKAKSRSEIIINFLAILELIKENHLRVNQKKVFSDIVLEKI